MKRFLEPIQNHRLIVFKGLVLFCFGVGCAIALGLNLTLVQIALLVGAIYGLCRAYYFAFYVIEKYVDPTYRFDGLYAFIGHLLRGRWTRR